jgi:hypothetical protein
MFIFNNRTKPKKYLFRTFNPFLLPERLPAPDGAWEIQQASNVSVNLAFSV